MADQPLHLLSQLGVLSSFSISKKITDADIDAFMAKGKRKGQTEEEIIEIVRNNIMEEIMEATYAGDLPGIILDKKVKNYPKFVGNMGTLNRMVTVLSDKLKSKKFSKMSLCYFINALVNSLDLTESDFEEFHRKLKDKDDDDGDDLHDNYDYE